jgi:transcriptional regulator NrdR family protein
MNGDKPMNSAPSKGGIECPRCGCRHFRVVYTRPRNNAIVRLRECRHCGRRVLTREQSVGATQSVPYL